MRPYSLPTVPEADLAAVHHYWKGLKRGNADMPFSDDVDLVALSQQSERLVVIDVFRDPVRFRLGIVGTELRERYGGDIVGKFSDEIEVRYPFEYINSQCFATVEGRSPTYYRRARDKRGGSRPEQSYARLLVPMWRDGHIGMLLGTVVWR